MKIECLNKKIDKFNSMESAKITYYIRPISIIKKTVNGSIKNRVTYKDTGEDVSESDVSTILDNTDAISKVTVINDRMC